MNGRYKDYKNFGTNDLNKMEFQFNSAKDVARYQEHIQKAKALHEAQELAFFEKEWFELTRSLEKERIEEIRHQTNKKLVMLSIWIGAALTALGIIVSVALTKMS